MRKGIVVGSLVSMALVLTSFAWLVVSGYTAVAKEGETKTFDVPTDVAYGANRSFAKKYQVVGNVSFSNSTFGDPAPNIRKAGYARPYHYVAKEGGSYYFNTPVVVAYGARQRYTYKYGVFGRIAFNNQTFGDPAPNTAKLGYYKPFEVACKEGQTIYINGTADVAYGAKGRFVVKHNVSGSITFNNQAFGTDPAPNVAKMGYINYRTRSNGPLD